MKTRSSFKSSYRNSVTRKNRQMPGLVSNDNTAKLLLPSHRHPPIFLVIWDTIKYKIYCCVTTEVFHSYFSKSRPTGIKSHNIDRFFFSCLCFVFLGMPFFSRAHRNNNNNNKNIHLCKSLLSGTPTF